jgi:DNA-binding SARP family transcriptional activator
VEAGGESLRLGGKRQRRVLATLLLASDRVVSTNSLAQAVWSEHPPATARNQIAICVAALRKCFREAGVVDLLHTSHPGYVLSQGEHRIDVLEFEERAQRGRAAARQGRIEEACALLEEALSQWRGPALDGLSGERIEAEAARFEQLRLDLLEERAGLQLQLGHHRTLIAELSELVKQHPLREQSRAHLMLARYRSGQRAEALEVFREGRQLLVDQLGIEPGPVLQRLHGLILQDSPELTQPPAVITTVSTAPAQLPAAVVAFTGRQQELAALDGLLTEPRDSRTPAVVTVVGMGGVGKTALAVHWANQVAGQFPDGQLFADLRGYDDQHEPVSPTAVLDRFLRSLGVPAAQIPPDPEERAGLFRSVLDTKRTLILLDNVRSFSQLRPLLPGNGRSFVLATSREAVDDLTGDYTRLRIRLRVLAPAEATALLTRIVGAERFGCDPVAVERLSVLCDRLPLALRIAGARLAAKPHLSVRSLVGRLQDQRRRLDELSPDQSGVRAGFRLTYRDLHPDAARLYRRLGLLQTSDFAAWTGATVLDTDVLRAEELIDQLVDAHLLEVSDSAPGRVARYRFQDLLRLFAQECARDDGPECDAALDRAFAGWLWLAEEAHRRLDGADYPLGRESAPAVGFPQTLVTELLAEPLEWFEEERAAIVSVIGHAAQTGRARQAWTLTESIIPLFETHNYLEDWQHCAEQALASARRAGDRTGEATMLRSLGSLAIYQRRYETAEGWNTAALRLFRESGDTHGSALALRNLAMCARFQGDGNRALRRCREALENFHHVGDASNEAHLLGFLSQVELDRGRVELAVELAREAVELSRQSQSVRAETQSIYGLGEALLHKGELEFAARSFREVLRLTRGDGDRVGEAHALRGMGETLWRGGDLTSAHAILKQALALVEHLADGFLRARIETDLSCVDVLGGRFRAAADRLERAQAGFGEVGAPLWRDRAERLLEAVTGGAMARCDREERLARLLENRSAGQRGASPPGFVVLGGG